MKKRIFDIIEPSDGDNKLSTCYDYAMILVIIVSLVPLAFKENNIYFAIIDYICASIFIIDYILRWYTADIKYKSSNFTSFIKYPFSFMAIIDLISILPTFLPLFSCFKILRLIRMFRAFRVFRVFKSFRYSKSIRMIVNVFKTSKDSLLAVGTLALVYILISALIIYNVEPEAFNNFFDAIYWATVSLTTVGYGDIYPTSNIGRIVTMVSTIFGIAIVALPAGIITAGYMNELENNENND